MPQPMLPQYLCNLHEEHIVPKTRKRGSHCSIALPILLTFVIICICHQLLEPVNQASIHAERSLQSDPHDRHPDKTVAVVQYDSPDRISILDCYLKRDLITNDGPLDSVIFFARPGISPSDSRALEDLISSSPHYIRFNISTSSFINFPTLLPLIAEEATLYITIPSTTVYIRPHALTHLINSKLAHPTQRLAIANSITAHPTPRHSISTSSPDQPPLTPSHRRTAWLVPPLRTVSDPPLDAETVPSRKAPASIQEYRSLLLSRLAANIRPPIQPPAQTNDPDPESSEESQSRIHTAFMQSLAFGRLDQWVRRSHPITPPRRYPVRATSANGLAAHTVEDTVAAVWGADVLDGGKRGTKVWEEEVWMDGMAVVVQLDGKGGGGEERGLVERWGGYAREMVCLRLREGGQEGVESK